MVAGFRRLREIAATEPLASARGRELIPGEGVESDGDVESFLRRETDCSITRSEPAAWAMTTRP